VPGDAEQAHSSCAVFDDERYVQAGERDRAVDVEEICGQERARMSAQEHVPGSVVPDGGGMRWARRILGMILAKTASTTRSVQDMRGLGFARRSTATSWRSASISMFLDDEDRASSASQDSTVTSSR